ncbi:hypothetical protein, partial [Burkholderia sp. SIMBA_062]|uniref:hypothetical protein n=1 Tax=Burkholderia sp. SIMBA_062 TaxID=3085803 RepID=UPI003979FC2F
PPGADPHAGWCGRGSVSLSDRPYPDWATGLSRQRIAITGTTTVPLRSCTAKQNTTASRGVFRLPCRAVRPARIDQ